MSADDFFNTTPPLKNSDAMKCLFNVLCDHTSRTLDLTQYLRGLEHNQLLIVQADGCKMYVAMGAAAGSISEIATGNGNTICYPVPDGTSLPMKPTSGREVATSYAATLCNYNVLHYISQATGVTGYLRGYRTVARMVGSEALKAP